MEIAAAMVAVEEQTDRDDWRGMQHSLRELDCKYQIAENSQREASNTMVGVELVFAHMSVAAEEVVWSQ